MANEVEVKEVAEEEAGSGKGEEGGVGMVEADGEVGVPRDGQSRCSQVYWERKVRVMVCKGWVPHFL